MRLGPIYLNEPPSETFSTYVCTRGIIISFIFLNSLIKSQINGNTEKGEESKSLYLIFCGTAMSGNLVLSNDKGAGTSSFKYPFHF